MCVCLCLCLCVCVTVMLIRVCICMQVVCVCVCVCVFVYVYTYHQYNRYCMCYNPIITYYTYTVKTTGPSCSNSIWNGESTSSRNPSTHWPVIKNTSEYHIDSNDLMLYIGSNYDSNHCMLALCCENSRGLENSSFCINFCDLMITQICLLSNATHPVLKDLPKPNPTLIVSFYLCLF